MRKLQFAICWWKAFDGEVAIGADRYDVIALVDAIDGAAALAESGRSDPSGPRYLATRDSRALRIARRKLANYGQARTDIGTLEFRE